MPKRIEEGLQGQNIDIWGWRSADCKRQISNYVNKNLDEDRLGRRKVGWDRNRWEYGKSNQKRQFNNNFKNVVVDYLRGRKCSKSPDKVLTWIKMQE